jgi:exosortase/archaeosortase family protein
MVEHAAPLNARIARTLPKFAVPLARAAAPARGNTRALSVPRVMSLLGALLAALWPHWHWMARRLTDGSDEPWGVLALATVIVLVARERRALATPSAAHLVAAGVLAVIAAVATIFLPPLLAGALAMLALAAFLAGALRARAIAPLLTLLLLALPIIASLQFYLGYPLRVVTAHAAAALLTGLGVKAAGAALEWQGLTVLVDAPCAGIGMFWMGSYVAALFSHLNGADARRTLLNGGVAALLVLAANVGRNVALFFPEAGLVAWPAWSHDAIGLLAFAAALIPLIAFTQRGRPHRSLA